MKIATGMIQMKKMSGSDDENADGLAEIDYLMEAQVM